MEVILLGLGRDGIFPQFFHRILMGRDFFVSGLKIHSCVTSPLMYIHSDYKCTTANLKFSAFEDEGKVHLSISEGFPSS